MKTDPGAAPLPTWLERRRARMARMYPAPAVVEKPKRAASIFDALYFQVEPPSREESVRMDIEANQRKKNP